MYRYVALRCIGGPPARYGRPQEYVYKKGEVISIQIRGKLSKFARCMIALPRIAEKCGCPTLAGHKRM